MRGGFIMSGDNDERIVGKRFCANGGGGQGMPPLGLGVLREYDAAVAIVDKARVCINARDAINRWLTGRSNPVEEVEIAKHIELCSTCADYRARKAYWLKRVRAEAQGQLRSSHAMSCDEARRTMEGSTGRSQADLKLHTVTCKQCRDLMRLTHDVGNIVPGWGED